MKDWYNGYMVNDISIYNPQSVVCACSNKAFGNYWTKTETFEALKVFIQLDMDGLRQSVIKMIAGERVKVNTEKFENDMTSFKSADDVITLLIHLGYLTYSNKSGEAWIPNKEVAQEFINCIEDGGAISQIKDKHYTENLEAFNGEILLVGISYDEKTKVHSCQIEKVVK